ncbi:ATP-grasp ribosomal peptide maturase [Pseudonocardia sp. MH-G8]|uniref:ATP-grasp ribosomal peptide maturase n=1 Tax=Pseudonocardia sp. MH-G8 TaxID=1854588 RepID=UPI000BA13DEF|nr:ATP-grasp ribosomal peptide maturase [Pseudonocardia sp. MH-G8]OZM81458.1 RimK domain-containing protein [Pseudonocardia sp. MH-G8]
MTVLILAAERDFTADRMVAALKERGVPTARMDTAWLPLKATVAAKFHAGQWEGTLRAGGRRIELEGLRSVWYRSPSAFQFPPELTETERRWAMAEAKLGVGGVLAALPVRWINHPSRNADAAYKPLQLTTAARCGLNVPDTLIGNVADAVRGFAAHGETVAKALGAPAIVEDGGRKTTFTHRLGPADLADLRGVEHTAHQFQRWVPKAFEARLIVVGERVFAAAIRAGSAASYVDWRNDYAALRYEVVEPPTAVTAGVLAYCAALGLTYGAFDFVIRPDGGWVFLECNPGGQYGWIEDAIDAPITETIADLLCEGNSAHDINLGELADPCTAAGATAR